MPRCFAIGSATSYAICRGLAFAIIGSRAFARATAVATVLVATDLIIRAEPRSTFTEGRTRFPQGLVHRGLNARALAIAKTRLTGAIFTRIAVDDDITGTAVAAVTVAGARTGAAVAVV